MGRAHVRTLPSGQTQLLIGLHLIHEVTTPQAFQMLTESKLKVRMPERTFGTLDHIIPDDDQARPYADPLAEEMAVHMIRNMKDFSLPLFDMSTGKQGIVHVIGPSSASSQPGMTDRLRRQPYLDPRAPWAPSPSASARPRCATCSRPSACRWPSPSCARCASTARLARGVYAKDVILAIINQLGVKGGVGYAYEYAGP
jgi:3-isopropylmalate/(R)-2-methylmalate dehydratase large subunit